MRFEREDKTPITHEVWAILDENEAFDLMRALGEYFALGCNWWGCHTHVGPENAELTIEIPRPDIRCSS